MTHQKPTRADLARWMEGAAVRWLYEASELAGLGRHPLMVGSIVAIHFATDGRAALKEARALYEAARHAAREGE